MTSHLDDKQISRLIDNDLSLTERSATLDHLSHCPACARRQSELVEVTAALRSVHHPEWTSSLTEQVLERLQTPAGRARPGSSIPLAIALAAFAAAFALVVAFVVPAGPLVAGAVFDLFAALPPLGGGSARSVLGALIAVALLAPALLYPLARWR